MSFYRPTVDNGLHWDAQMQEPLSRYTAKTFGWMALGLLTTFFFAIAFAVSSACHILYSVPALPFILLLAEVGIVIYLASRLESLSLSAAKSLFFIYAILNGVTFSSLFILYDVSSLVFVFALTAVYFAVLAAYGYFTKRDLSALRPLLIAGSIFLLAFWVLSMFLPFSGAERAMCFVGLLVFMGYTAYDTQKIRHYHQIFAHDAEMANKASIFGALQLYLDFINMFLYILRIIGRARD